jgi:hypothetical protein
MKNTKNTKKTDNQVVTINNEGINWNAKYYREKAQLFTNSASYSAPSEPVVFEMSKSVRKAEIKAGLTAAAKVRHNPVNKQLKQLAPFVMIGGVPHKRKDGKLVPMIPAKDSKKWDVIEA